MTKAKYSSAPNTIYKSLVSIFHDQNMASAMSILHFAMQEATLIVPYRFVKHESHFIQETDTQMTLPIIFPRDQELAYRFYVICYVLARVYANHSSFEIQIKNKNQRNMAFCGKRQHDC